MPPVRFPRGFQNLREFDAPDEAPKHGTTRCSSASPSCSSLPSALRRTSTAILSRCCDARSTEGCAQRWPPHGSCFRPSSLVWRAQERTQWAEVPHKASPRFGVSRTVIIEALPEDLPEDESYKMCG